MAQVQGRREGSKPPAPRCSLEELLRPELREGKYGGLDLRRVALVLDKYRELDRHSSFSGMHKSKSKQAEVGRQGRGRGRG